MSVAPAYCQGSSIQPLTMICTAKDSPPVLICSKCGRPMTYLATLPAILNLPAIHAFQCRPCLRVDSITLA